MRTHSREGAPAPRDRQAKPLKESYGLDAPRLLAVPAVLVAAGAAQAILARSVWPVAGIVALAALAGLGLHASVRGKFAVWARLVDEMHLTGDEHLLDLGCGRGAVLVTAARKLPRGRAVGVDLWHGADQSGNAAAATLLNAAAAGVAERVEVHTADMAELPFADASFDVVVSNVAVHNVRLARRDRVVDEAVRVLRPGGHLFIADLQGSKRCSRRLRLLSMLDVRRRSLGWRMWWSGPWLRTMLVTATKPSA